MNVASGTGRRGFRTPASKPTAIVTTGNTPNGIVTLQGDETPTVGSTLSFVLTDPDTPVNVGSYIWKRDNQSIHGYKSWGRKNAKTYTLTNDDIGNKITLQIKHTDKYGDQSTESLPTSPVSR